MIPSKSIPQKRIEKSCPSPKKRYTHTNNSFRLVFDPKGEATANRTLQYCGPNRWWLFRITIHNFSELKSDWNACLVWFTWKITQLIHHLAVLMVIELDQSFKRQLRYRSGFSFPLLIGAELVPFRFVSTYTGIHVFFQLVLLRFTINFVIIKPRSLRFFNALLTTQM